MRKIFHEALVDFAKPTNATDPVFVLITTCSLSEVEYEVSKQLKALKPWLGMYQLVVEFTEPETDSRFVIGHIGAKISVRTESESLAEEMRKAI